MMSLKHIWNINKKRSIRILSTGEKNGVGTTYVWKFHHKYIYNFVIHCDSIKLNYIFKKVWTKMNSKTGYLIPLLTIMFCLPPKK